MLNLVEVITSPRCNSTSREKRRNNSASCNTTRNTT